jgi:hypothetical protein
MAVYTLVFAASGFVPLVWFLGNDDVSRSRGLVLLLVLVLASPWSVWVGSTLERFLRKKVV